ncbi:MAG: hypothetical protein ISP86_04330 [Shewanellaceae bacterium]|nr:hypothetical protein [Shewanellaceae bacterium]
MSYVIMQVALVFFWLLGLFLLTACSDTSTSDSAATAQINLQPIARISALYGNKSFGSALATSKDGKVVAIGSKASKFQCVDSGHPVMVSKEEDTTNCSETSHEVGGVHVYHVDGDDTTGFVIKPFKQDASFEFGADVSVSDDGQWLAVGAPKDSMHHPSDGTKCASSMTATVATTDCTSTVTTTTADGYQAGAVYIFKYSDNDKNWELKHYVKPLYAQTSPFIDYQFGRTVALTSNGTGVIVGVPTDKNNISGNVLAEPDLIVTQALARGATFHYALDESSLTFKFYHQSPGSTPQKTGKIVQTLVDSEQVAVAGVSIWFLASQTGKESNLDLSSLNLPANVVISDVAQSSNMVVLGLENMKSNCSGVKTGEDASGCYNGDGGVAEAGAILIYHYTNQPVFEFQTLITLAQPIPNAHFGRSVMVSQDSQYIWVGADDNRGCVGSFDTIEACTAENEADLNGSGAVYQYKKSGDTWVLDKFMKAAKVEANGNFGGSNQLFQQGNLFYFGYERSDLCNGYTSNIKDVCSSILDLPTFNYEVRAN